MLHLIHPALVHFSAAFLILGGLCEAAGLLFGRQAAQRFGSSIVLVGTLSLIPTIVSGYLAANSVTLRAGVARTLDAHEQNGLILLAVFGASLFWKAWNRGQLPEGQRPFFAALLIVGVMLTFYGAYLGGRLVYVYGVGVGS